MAKKMTFKLKVEMVPQTSWGVSLRNKIPRSKWDKLRRAVHEKNGNKCEICGSTERLSCHEHWEFDETTKQQKLVGLGTICGMCHHATHFGRSTQLAQQGQLDLDAVVQHFLRVNNCSMSAFKEHLTQATELFSKRSEITWDIDFGEYSYLVADAS